MTSMLVCSGQPLPALCPPFLLVSLPTLEHYTVSCSPVSRAVTMGIPPPASEFTSFMASPSYSVALQLWFLQIMWLHPPSYHIHSYIAEYK